MISKGNVVQIQLEPSSTLTDFRGMFAVIESIKTDHNYLLSIPLTSGNITYVRAHVSDIAFISLRPEYDF